MKTFLLIVGFLLVAGIGIAGWKFSRFGYESPDYQVLKKDGAFEIRNYPSMTVVSTPMKSGNPDGDGSFMRLFRYISKGNEADAKIAMTTPVFMDEGRMSFVVPADVAKNGAPAPKSDEVEVDSMVGGKVAVYRYSGNWSQENRAAAREKLADWVKSRGLESLGDYFSAGYDPPFTPEFLRRNEVLIRIFEG